MCKMSFIRSIQRSKPGILDLVSQMLGTKHVFCFCRSFGFCASFPIVRFSVIFVNIDSCPESEDRERLGSYTGSKEVLHSFGVLFVSHACSPEEGQTCCCRAWCRQWLR